MTIPPQTEIQKKRADWWAEHFKSGMSRSEVFCLIEEVANPYPMTPEERERKVKEWEGVPEFVL